MVSNETSRVRLVASLTQVGTEAIRLAPSAIRIVILSCSTLAAESGSGNASVTLPIVDSEDQKPEDDNRTQVDAYRKTECHKARSDPGI